MDNQIAILHLITSLNVGGTEKYLLYITKALKSKFKFYVGYLKQEGDVAAELRAEGIPVYKLNNLYKLYVFCKKNKIQLLHTHLYRANILGRIMGKFANVSIIISSQRSIDGWKRLYHVLLDKWTINITDCIIANCEAAKKILIEREKVKSNKICVIYNGVDIKNYVTKITAILLKKELKINDSIPIIGYIGRLHCEKGVDYIPEIAVNLKKYIPQFKFVIIGEGPCKQELRREIKNRDLTENIILISGKENILDFISIMDLVVLPSREESFPQVILEAMSMAKPVVAADVGGVGEIVINGVNGTLVPPGDAEAFTQGICQILQDKNKAYEMGQAGRKQVLENFGIEKMINATESIYNKLIGQKIK